MNAEWGSYLAQLQDSVARHRTRLAGPRSEELDIPPFLPPTHLGPMPADVAPLARALLGELTTLEDELRARRDQVGRELRMHRHLTTERSVPAGAAYFDQRG